MKRVNRHNRKVIQPELDKNKLILKNLQNLDLTANSLPKRDNSFDLNSLYHPINYISPL